MFKLESRNQHVDGQIDGRTDIRHINLIGWLVKSNLPKRWGQSQSLHKKRWKEPIMLCIISLPCSCLYV